VRILVTGGAGFIGSNLVAILEAEEHTVRVLDDLSTGSRKNLGAFRKVDFLEGDVRDADLVSKAVEGVDVIFHLAASVGNVRSIARPLEDAEINVLGTLNVLEAARRADVRKVIFSSSAAIFGELKCLPIREDHPLDPDSPYGASKLAAEKLCRAYAKLYELEIICLRYFNVYGPNQRYDAYGNVIPTFAHRLLQGLPLVVFGDGEQTRDFVNVRDVARVNLLAAQVSGVSGAFNIASGQSLTINDLANLMREIAGVRVEVQYRSPRKGDVRHSTADISAASKVLGYEPTVPIREGLVEYLAWARTEMEEKDGPS
jgi:UDP-glucose 4-epimerase